jgi:hypothetical protein
MKSAVSRVWAVTAVGLALGLSLVSGGTLLAAQQAPAAPAPQADPLLFTQNVPHLIVWALKPGKAADFEAAWKMLDEQFAKSERPEVKEFAASITRKSKVDTGTAPDAPAIYLFEISSPSLTQSYNPNRIVYEFLYSIKEGKEVGIPRADADAIYAKLGNPLEMYQSVVPWALKKMGS